MYEIQPEDIVINCPIAPAKTASVLRQPDCGVTFGDLVDLGIVKSAEWFCETCKAEFVDDPPANKCPKCSGDPVPDVPANRAKYDKQAGRSFLGEAIGERLNTPFASTGNPMQDMASYITSVPHMAKERIRLAEGSDRMKGFYDPQYRYEQTLRMLEGQPDEIVTNKYDRMLQAFPALNT